MAERILIKRKNLGISQVELAAYCKISQQAIAKIEDGRTLKTKYIHKIAECLNVSPSWLEYGEESEKPDVPLNNVEEAVLLNGFRQLSKESKKAILVLVKQLNQR